VGCAAHQYIRVSQPLAISRILPEFEHLHSGIVDSELEAMTGKNFGFDHARWKECQASRANPN
jgi:hypothetical protein